MQITANTSGMPADFFVATDKDAADHCVVVVKGTFQTNQYGEMTLAAKQRSLISTDDHYGDPATTSVRYECDFVLAKPFTDVLVVGKALSPGGKAVTRLPVSLVVQRRTKDLMVSGDRRWVRSLGRLVSTSALPFVELPLTFERAFGGRDDSRGPDQVAVEPRNPVGVGFHPHRSAAEIEGMPVPNLELPGCSLASPRELAVPVGYGCVGRSWQPRANYAGTYGARWREERAPFLPADFDNRYYQCAPPDQQFPHFRGGEQLCCVHMVAEPIVRYVIPDLSLSVRFRFIDTVVVQTAVLDTVMLEPHLGLAALVWRTSVPLRKKLAALQEIFIGDLPSAATNKIVGYRNGKPVFARLSAAIEWTQQRRLR